MPRNRREFTNPVNPCNLIFTVEISAVNCLRGVSDYAIENISRLFSLGFCLSILLCVRIFPSQTASLLTVFNILRISDQQSCFSKIKPYLYMEERTYYVGRNALFPQVITMGHVIDSTLMHINKGNAHGTQGNAPTRLIFAKA